MEKSDNVLQYFVRILFSNKIMLVAVTLIITGLATLISFYFPPVFLLQGSLIVKSKQMESSPSQLEQGGLTRYTLPPEREDLLTETRIITSPALVRECVEEMLGDGISFESPTNPITDWIKESVVADVKEWISTEETGEELSEVDAQTLEITENLESLVFEGSNVIDISLSHSNPELGAQILNRMFDKYFEYRLKLLANKQASNFFKEQLDSIREEIDTLEGEKLLLMKNGSIADLGYESEGVMLQSVKVNDELIQLESLVLDKEKQVSYLDDLFQQYIAAERDEFVPFPHDFEDGEIRTYNELLNELQHEFAQDVSEFKGDSPKRKSIKEEIDALSKKMILLVKQKVLLQKNELSSMEARLSTLQQRMESLLERNRTLSDIRSHVEHLDRVLEIKNENYRTFSRKYEESRIAFNEHITQISNIQVLHRADVPTEPTFPRKEIVIPFGFIAGLLLALGLGFIKEFFDHTFKTPAHVEQHLGLPVIGSVPIKKRSPGGKL